MRIYTVVSATIFLAQALSASVAYAADSSPLNPPSNLTVSGAQILSVAPAPSPDRPSQAGVFPGTNVRHRSCIGTRAAGISWDVGDTWFDSEYEAAMQIIRADQPQAFDEDVAACVMRKLTWRQMYVNDSVAPSSSAQARNPNWSNYVWNTDDSISRQLDSQYIRSGEAMMGVLIADQSTAQKNAPPQWYIDRGHTFGQQDVGRYHNRMDKPVALAHVIDFYIAFVRKYGSDKRLQSIVLGEYFAYSQKYWPSDFNKAAYTRGRREIWRAIVAEAPLDENGNRIAIYQTQPVLNSGVSVDDLLSLQVGVSESDVNLFKDGCGSSSAAPECEEGRHAWALQVVEGKVPTMMNGDSRAAREGHHWTWSGIDNPFGLGKGARTVASPQQLYWYRGSRGVIPLNSLFLRLEKSAEPQTFENLLDAVRMFGRGGTHAAQWGSVPLISK